MPVVTGVRWCTKRRNTTPRIPEEDSEPELQEDGSLPTVDDVDCRELLDIDEPRGAHGGLA